MVTRNPDERLIRLLQDARDKLEAERNRRTEPIAIVGIGCRFPGGSDGPRQLWQLLEGSTDATSGVPLSRWDAEAIFDADPDASGKSYVRRGGFLGDVAGFDAAFFGISPREARGLDPQQRLLLETTVEALEDAGIPLDTLQGSATGVWVGFSLDDYGARVGVDAHAALGNARSIAAGRISYVLGTRGPALQIDTSCSSSLVATHLACQSLRARECDLALVGGVNLLLAADSTVALCKLRALAPDGRCKTFDASADGYGRGEGCGVVVLKRLSDVQPERDQVYAVIRGSAVNHDGRSNGLTAPNGAAQEEVIRQALAGASLDPSSIQYVEAHGTGTPLGDPIEVLALGRVYGSSHSLANPLLIGSIKTNLGHLEGAAGVAGLIKAALCLQRGQVLPHINYAEPNPRIPWSTLAVRVAARGATWPDVEGPRRAGVSAFGISGTNAHVILEQAPSAAPFPSARSRSAEIVVLSARSAPALDAAVARLHDYLRGDGEHCALQDVARMLAVSRAVFEYRAAFSAASIEDLLAGLKAHLDVSRSRVHEPEPASRPGKVAFVFPGQGSQWLGMGRQLLREEPVFQEQLHTIDAAIQREAGWSVLAELAADEASSKLARVDVVQPVLFALQVSLARTWQAWGVVPDLVVGHSMGEVAAAHVAGALALEDAVAIICRRSRLLSRVSGFGAMALVELSLAEATTAIRGYEDRVSIAVSNGTKSTVLSGDPLALNELKERLTRADVFVRHVKVDVASHSPQVDPLLPELERALGDLKPRQGQIPIYSTVTGTPLGGAELNAKYWADNLRQPVRFASVVAELLRSGFTAFVEVSAHPLLTSAIDELRNEAGVSGVSVGSLRREQPERRALLDSLGGLFVNGFVIRPAALFPAGGVHVKLPTYAWQREHFWIDPPPRDGGAGAPTGHPLLGGHLQCASGESVFTGVLDVSIQPWLADHVVLGEVVVPATAFLELAKVAADVRSGAPNTLQSMTIVEPLVLHSGEPRSVQTIVYPDSRVEVHSQPASMSVGSSWTLHATGTVALDASSVPGRGAALSELRRRCNEPVDTDQLYAGLQQIGLTYGRQFRNLRRLWRGAGEVLAEVQLAPEAAAEGYACHPALLDAALHGIAALLPPGSGLALPVGASELSVPRSAERGAWAHVALDSSAASGELAARVRLFTDAGSTIACIDRLVLRSVATGVLAHPVNAIEAGFYRLTWSKVDPIAPRSRARRKWAVVATSSAATSLADELSRRGEEVVQVGADQLGENVRGTNLVCVWDAAVGGSGAIDQVCRALELIQRVAGRLELERLWHVVPEGVDVTGHDRVNPAGSAVIGLIRTVREEHPELRCTALDVTLPEAPTALLREAASNASDGLVAWRGPARHVPQLVSLPRDDRESLAPHVRPGGSVIITGGLGGLGLVCARYLAEQGVAHLVLVGRRGADTKGSVEAVAALKELGARVSVVRADVSDADAVRDIVRAIPSDCPLRGVVHAAGVLDDGVILHQNVERLNRVMAPKVLGAWNLHRATQHLNLDLFVLFSSLAGTLGSAGQVGYNAANCFLDGLAAWRKFQGLPSISIAWGPWKGAGLLSTLSPSQIGRLSQRGVFPLEVHEGAALLAQALVAPAEVLIAAKIDLARLVAREPLEAVARGSASKRDALKALAAADPDQRRALVSTWVRDATAQVLMLRGSSSLSNARPLRDFGLDSLMSMQLRQTLDRHWGIRLAASVPLAQLTLDAVVERVLEQLESQNGRGGAASALVTGPEPRKTRVEVTDMTLPASWECISELGSPRARMFCFHDGGGNAAMYQPFHALSGFGIEIHVIQHQHDAPVSEEMARRYLDLTVDYIDQRSDQPYVLFGHSLGVAAAWRTLVELVLRARRLPLFLAASAPPVAPELRASLHSTQDVVAALNRKGILDQPRKEAAFRRRFEADVALMMAMPAFDFAPVDVPIVCFVGREDNLVPEALVLDWQRATRADFSLSTMPGDHFYLAAEASRVPVFNEIIDRLEQGRRPVVGATSMRRVTSSRWA